MSLYHIRGRKTRNIIDTTSASCHYVCIQMKNPALSFLACLAAMLPACADDGLPVLQRETLPNEQMWQLETELVGQKERNAAVLECLTNALHDLLLQAGGETTVESLVLVLTNPSEYGTPQSSIKELLLPRARSIQVSLDGSFAIIATPVRGGSSIEIFRDTARGLTVQRIRR